MLIAVTSTPIATFKVVLRLSDGGDFQRLACFSTRSAHLVPAPCRGLLHYHGSNQMWVESLQSTRENLREWIFQANNSPDFKTCYVAVIALKKCNVPYNWLYISGEHSQTTGSHWRGRFLITFLILNTGRVSSIKSGWKPGVRLIHIKVNFLVTHLKGFYSFVQKFQIAFQKIIKFKAKWINLKNKQTRTSIMMSLF